MQALARLLLLPPPVAAGSSAAGRSDPDWRKFRTSLSMAATFLPYDALIWVGLVLIILTCMYTLRACMSACCPAKAGAATQSSLPATSSSSETACLTDLEAQRSPEAQAPSKDTAWLDVFCAPRLSEPGDCRERALLLVKRVAVGASSFVSSRCS